MGHRIVYPALQPQKHFRGNRYRLPLLTAAFFLAWCGIVSLQWDEGRQLLGCCMEKVKGVFTELDRAAEVFLYDETLAEALPDLLSTLIP